MIVQAQSCIDVVNLLAKKINATVAALVTQASTTTGSGCTEAAAEGHADSNSTNGGQHERLSVNDTDSTEPRFFHWAAPPGREATPPSLRKMADRHPRFSHFLTRKLSKRKVQI